MSTIGDIMDSIEAKIVAITPSVSGEAFHVADGEEPLAEMVNDGSFERAVELATERDVTVTKPWGDGSNPEVEQKLNIRIGYLSAQDNRAMTRRMESDQEQVVVALQSAGLTWPAGLTNIRPDGFGTWTDVGGGGNNAMLLETRWLLTYDIQ